MLNQGIGSQAARMSSNRRPKTPFKKPANDENAVLVAKSVAKTTAARDRWIGGFTHESVAKELAKESFVTPAGPTRRAPLGNKTVNAKAGAFQTPACPTALATDTARSKSLSPRLRRTKVKIHQVHIQNPQENSPHGSLEREVEYMPPRAEPLSEYPEDFPPDMEYPMLQGGNLTRGWFETYHDPVEEDGLTRCARLEKESEEKWRAHQDAIIQIELDKIPNLSDPDPSPSCWPTIASSTDTRNKRKMPERRIAVCSDIQGATGIRLIPRTKKNGAVESSSMVNLPKKLVPSTKGNKNFMASAPGARDKKVSPRGRIENVSKHLIATKSSKLVSENNWDQTISSVQRRQGLPISGVQPQKKARSASTSLCNGDSNQAAKPINRPQTEEQWWEAGCREMEAWIDRRAFGEGEDLQDIDGRDHNWQIKRIESDKESDEESDVFQLRLPDDF